jgi:hypothetical protein
MMFIQTEPTPNPASLKFLPGREVMSRGVLDFTDPDRTQSSPLARRLFEVEGVNGVFLGTDFITVTKSEGQDWYVLKPAVLGAIMEHYLSGDPVVEPEAAAGDDAGAAHPEDGGDIIFRGFERGIVYLHMRGSCAGCPSSTITLKNGIENLLRYYVPEVVEVRPVA